VFQDNLIKYCKTHGYDIFMYEKEIFLFNSMWQKVPYINMVMMQEYAKEYEYFVWLDDDAYITNHSVRFEKFINFAPEYHMWISKDIPVDSNIMLVNCGVFIWRNSDVMIEFFEDILQSYNRLPMFREGYFHEQTVTVFLYYKKYSEKIAIFPYGLLQVFPATRSWDYGDFILHFAGVDMNSREKYANYMEKNGVDDRVKHWNL